MLAKYKQDYEKIAMGLLSFIPDLRALTNIQTELAWYQKDRSKRTLLLWKQSLDANFAGVIGIEIADTTVVVRQIAVSPTERNHGVVYTMLDELAQRYSDYHIMGSIETAELIKKWELKDEH